MPFKKEGDHYVSPSGRKFTKKQVALYYATNGTFEKEKQRGRSSTRLHRKRGKS